MDRAETPFEKSFAEFGGSFPRYSYFDTRIVRRSNMLLADMGGQPYGKSLNFLQFSVLPADAWWHCQADEVQVT